MKNRYIEKILPWLVSSEADCDRDLDLSNGLYIYGAGDLGALALEYCEACGIQIKGFLDRARTVNMISSSGRPYSVYQPDSAKEAIDKSVPVLVAIATSPYTPVAHQLRALNWKSVTPFYNLTSAARIGHPLRNGWSLGEVSHQEKEMVEFICNRWADEISWQHYEAFLAWHRDNTEIETDTTPINPSERYALPELQKALQNRQKVFVDIGSHQGESIARMNNIGMIFNEYELFEPDPTSRGILQSKKEQLIPCESTFVIHSDVLSEEIGNFYFQSGLGYCSQLWKEGSELRQTATLDSFNLNPDFLKIHTEGTEMQILEGARQTIERSRPVIAYSVYHRREGFYSDIAEAMGLISGYQWFFRLHSFQGTGAFVYAIPN